MSYMCRRHIFCSIKAWEKDSISWYPEVLARVASLSWYPESTEEERAPKALNGEQVYERLKHLMPSCGKVK